MEIVIGIALVLGIIWGVSRAIAGAEVSRLRNALQLATKQAANSGAEADMLRRTLDTYESALRARDHHIDVLLARLADTSAEAACNKFRLDPTTPACTSVGDELPERVRVALFGGSRVVPAAAITGDDDGAFVVPSGHDGVLGAAADDAVEFIEPVEVDMTMTITTAQTVDEVRDQVVAELTGKPAVEKTGEWIEHSGSAAGMPHCDTIVDVEHRDGRTTTGMRAGDHGRYWIRVKGAACDGDIMRYRVVQHVVSGAIAGDGTGKALPEVPAEAYADDAVALPAADADGSDDESTVDEGPTLPEPFASIHAGEAGWVVNTGKENLPLGTRVDVLVDGEVHRGCEVNRMGGRALPGNRLFWARDHHFQAGTSLCLRVTAYRLLDQTTTEGV